MPAYYVTIHRQPKGPFSVEDIRAQVQSGRLQTHELYWTEGMPTWAPLTLLLDPSIVSPIALDGPPPLPPFPIADLKPRYAGFWIRCAAEIIDSILVSSISGPPLNFLFLAFLLPPPPPGIGGNERVALDYAMSLLPLALAYLLVTYVIHWLYHAIMESSARQATWGKVICGLVISDLNGDRISFGRATSRFFAKQIVGHILTLGVGFMFCGWTEKKQCLHDILVNTVVTHGLRK
jgi:uncharacterized RDD family membrane protein YckC